MGATVCNNTAISCLIPDNTGENNNKDEMLQLPSYFVWFGWLTSKNTRRFFISFLFSKKKKTNSIYKEYWTEQNTINQRVFRAVFVMFGMLIYEAYQMRKYYNVYMIYCDLITKTTLYSSFLWLTRVTWLTFFFVSKSVWLLDVVCAFSCILWGFWLNNNLLYSNSVSWFLISFSECLHSIW